MAGQLLGKLRAADAASPTVRHEARLGILVITILVFAFGFLVYHKMDMHQRSLTQASIPSAAEAKPSSQLINTTTQLERPTPPSAANDPLLNLADLSDGSPFSAGEVTAITESVKTETVTPEFSFDEPSIEMPSNGKPSTNVTSFDPGFGDASGNDFSAESSQSVDTETVLIDASAPVSGRASAAESASIDFPAFNDAPRSDPPVSVPTISEPVLSSSSFESDPWPGESVEAAPEAGSAQFSEPLTEATTELNDFAESTNDTSDDRSGEPMLLAMLEPQQDNGFSGGFTVDEPSVPVRQAPVAEPLDPFPAMNATDTSGPQTQEPKISKSENSSMFGMQGHNAVTQPGRQSGKNSIRTAAGSGSDGKFSLAAFNYQNNDAEPAPDDGSTFDSVVVREGDNYTTISKRVYGTVRYFSALAVFNQHRIREPKSMRPGMVVLTPPKDVLEKRYPQLFVDSQPKVVEPAEFLILSDGSPAYRVGERETLSEISSRFLGRSSRWIEIYRLNQTIVNDPNKLKSGLILALPADAAEVSVVP